MSGLPQTPQRYAPGQYVARPGTPGQLPMGTPPQRPTMNYRPGMPLQPHTPQQQQQQQQAMMAGRGIAMTPQQMHYNQQLQQQQQQQFQQQYLQQQQQMARAGLAPGPGGAMRPGMALQQPQSQMFAYTGATSIAGGIGIPAQQHPALIQPAAMRKRKSNRPGQEVAGAAGAAAADEGDELDSIQPYNISLARYQNNHNLMSEIFMAVPTSAITPPKHYYEDMSYEAAKTELEALDASIEECKKEHADRVRAIQSSREEFAELAKTLVGAADADAIRTAVEEKFGMAFVDNPYRTIERVPVTAVDAAEGAVYKQL
ncbi:hypothetical protein IWQ56_002815 [Coemansia nantahalensis]|nr:hypothetical protein IWQ56_002815 [Coemansia nantahalensis]